MSTFVQIFAFSLVFFFSLTLSLAPSRGNVMPVCVCVCVCSPLPDKVASPATSRAMCEWCETISAPSVTISTFAKRCCLLSSFVVSSRLTRRNNIPAVSHGYLVSKPHISLQLGSHPLIFPVQPLCRDLFLIVGAFNLKRRQKGACRGFA